MPGQTGDSYSVLPVPAFDVMGICERDSQPSFHALTDAPRDLFPFTVLLPMIACGRESLRRSTDLDLTSLEEKGIR